jgi:hypothetical protein
MPVDGRRGVTANANCGFIATEFAAKALISLMFLPLTSTAQVTVVNIIPKSLSYEYNQDSEPNLAVNPAKRSQIAASAFTPDPLNGPTAPIFVSINGGNTWTLNSVLPSETSTADITLRFGSASNALYAAILKRPVIDRRYEMVICRTSNLTDPTTMMTLVNRRGRGVDQPFVSAATIAGKDAVFVGNNDFNGSNGHTATIDRSNDSAVAPPPAGFNAFRIESRTTSCGHYTQDGPEIRPAVSSDGKTVYSIFNGWRRCSDDLNIGIVTADVVVVRDDNGGAGTSPFTALRDPQDNSIGIRIVQGRQFAWDSPHLGKQRVSGDLAIAVDPRDSKGAYVAWSDYVNQHTTLHLTRSTDAGLTWSKDLRTLVDARNPAIAVNSKGTVGFLYQQVIRSPVDGDVWTTNFERGEDGFATKPTVITLSNFPVSELEPPWQPFLGDYLHLMTVDKDFYGIFSASNKPDKTRFPSGVVFQRNADFAAKKLLTEDGSAQVRISVDPYFFKVTE